MIVYSSIFDDILYKINHNFICVNCDLYSNTVYNFYDLFTNIDVYSDLYILCDNCNLKE